MSVEPARKLGGIVDAAFQPACDIEQAEIGLQVLLGVGEEKTLLEIGHRRASFEPVIGRKDRAARYAGDEVDAIEQRRRAGAGRHVGLIEAG